MRQFFLFLLREGIRADNPALELSTPRLPHSLPKYLSESEVDSLLLTAAEWPGVAGLKGPCRAGNSLRDRLARFGIIGFAGGGTSSDARILMIKGKGGKERIVPLSDAAKQAAARLREGTKKPGRFLFTGRDARLSMTRQGFALLLKQVAGKANIDPGRLSPHVLRHSFASHMLARGGGFAQFAEAAGACRYRDDANLYAGAGGAVAATGAGASSVGLRGG